MIRTATAADAEAICGIYNHYVTETVVTFEEQPVSTADMAGRIKEITRTYPWLLAVENGSVVGYAYAGPFRTRSAWRQTVESAIYLRPAAGGKGLGTRLYRELLRRLRAAGFQAVIGSISLPNPASTALHEKLGFKQVAHLREVGFKFGQRLDVGYWQLLLEQFSDGDDGK